MSGDPADLPHGVNTTAAVGTNGCTCHLVPEHYHHVHYGATEPGSAWEWNPDCPQHPAASNQGAHDA